MRLSFDTLFWLVDAAVYHVQAWVLTRRQRLLLERLPAIVLAVGMLSLFTRQFGGPDPDLVSRYPIAVENALVRSDVSKSRALAGMDDIGTATDSDADRSGQGGPEAGGDDHLMDAAQSD